MNVSSELSYVHLLCADYNRIINVYYLLDRHVSSHMPGTDNVSIPTPITFYCKNKVSFEDMSLEIEPQVTLLVSRSENFVLITDYVP